ncbi:protein GPR108 [Protopterus annectens]|uniref:protein GPR108 n=1 Tax=Protopterus annectens TaxID=7888 RepID=UPI001CFC2D89|nr:protein GPR108 [Protopterus annectens]
MMAVLWGGFGVKQWTGRLCLPIVLLLNSLSTSVGRIHHLSLKDETRPDIQLITFGFFTNGTLSVNLSSLTIHSTKVDFASQQIGFILSKSVIDGGLFYSRQPSETCPLKSAKKDNVLSFVIDLEKKRVLVIRSNMQNLTVTEWQQEEAVDKGKTQDESLKTEKKPPAKNSPVKVDQKSKRGADDDDINNNPSKQEQKEKYETLALSKVNNSYSFNFTVMFGSQAEEGLYTLNFFNCYNLGDNKNPFSIEMKIVEQNPGGYLSASEIPLPLLYIIMSAFFFAAAIFWVSILLQHRLKGALFFITLALIGTGLAFIKYILSDKEKKIFMIVIPLQVLANVAYIFIESSVEGTSEYLFWGEILFLVDLVCCGAILFPVIWSIRHLQEASSTDGKAAMNLAKLKLFRHYYVMIVCYIYFTRIIAMMLKVTVRFQWQWFYQLLVEVSTLVFFVLTGYKFRPASNNPYLQLPQDEEDVETDEVLTESGVLEGVSKVKKSMNGREKIQDSAV